MNRHLLNMNIKLYYEWLLNEHCQMVKNDSLDRYLFQRAIIFSYADYFIYSLKMSSEQVFKMLLMGKEELDEYQKFRLHLGNKD